MHKGVGSHHASATHVIQLANEKLKTKGPDQRLRHISKHSIDVDVKLGINSFCNFFFFFFLNDI